jgi:choline dehydrogenase-like flavoprotein
VKPLDYSAASYVGTQIHTADTQAEGSLRLKTDVVIVGTGPGGLSAGAILADAGAKVVFLEAGQFWPRGSFERSQSWTLKNLVQDNQPRIAMGNTHVPVLSGKGVGGGTLINSGISFRTPDRVLDEWMQTHGLDYWEDRDALYSEVEAAIGVAPTPRSVAGKNAEVHRRGFEKLGVEHGYMPRNTPGCIGCGTCQTGCPSGGKASSDLNWLPRALRADAVVYADTEVDRILTRGDRVVGVRGQMRHPHDGRHIGEIEVLADRVILAAGAINTPVLLLENGLANSSGQVGENLHFQPGGAALAEFDEEIKIWSGATQGYYARHPDDPEVLAEAFSSSPEAFVVAAADPGADAHRFLRHLGHIAGSGFLIRDHSSGTITPAGTGPPRISYDVIDSDRHKMTIAAEFITRMFFAAGARRVRPLLSGAKWFDTWQECTRFIRTVTSPADYSLYASHPMGTCQIGDDPRRCVVRPDDGRTHDHEGLYVMDASLMPTALGVNPQMTIMAQSIALARRLARA